MPQIVTDDEIAANIKSFNKKQKCVTEKDAHCETNTYIFVLSGDEHN